MKDVAWNYKRPADDDDRILAYKNNFNVGYDENSINESGETYLQNITSSKNTAQYLLPPKRSRCYKLLISSSWRSERGGK